MPTLRLLPPDHGRDWIALARVPLPAGDALQWATVPTCGGVVLFSGVARDHSPGREQVTGLTYEAYEAAAERGLAEVAAEARRQWAGVGRVVLLHRLGEVPLGESAVVVVVSAPHRDEAFVAARFCIDTLKARVPLWKQEHWPGGSEWVAEHDLDGHVEAPAGG